MFRIGSVLLFFALAVVSVQGVEAGKQHQYLGFLQVESQCPGGACPPQPGQPFRSPSPGVRELPGGSAPPRPASDPAAPARAVRATTRFTGYSGNQIGHGSAVAVARLGESTSQLLVTARHNLESMPGASWSVICYNGVTLKATPLSVDRYNEDLAAVTVDEPIDAVPLGEPGGTGWKIGYPEGRGPLARRCSLSLLGSRIETSGYTQGGDSGGGVYSENGNLVGITVTRSMDYMSGQAVPTEKLHRFVNACWSLLDRLKGTQPQPQPSQPRIPEKWRDIPEVVPGPQGPQGPQGPPGQQGPPGPPGRDADIQELLRLRKMAEQAQKAADDALAAANSADTKATAAQTAGVLAGIGAGVSGIPFVGLAGWALNWWGARRRAQADAKREAAAKRQSELEELLAKIKAIEDRLIGQATSPSATPPSPSSPAPSAGSSPLGTVASLWEMLQRPEMREALAKAVEFGKTAAPEKAAKVEAAISPILQAIQYLQQLHAKGIA